MIYSIAAILEAILISPRLPVIQSVRLSFFFTYPGVYYQDQKSNEGHLIVHRTPPSAPGLLGYIQDSILCLTHSFLYI